MVSAAVKEKEHGRSFITHSLSYLDPCALEQGYRVEEDHDELREEIEREDRIFREMDNE